MVEVSVIVPTLEPPHQIDVRHAIERDEFSDYELIVCDDDTVTAARNAGIEQASADKLVFLDDDSRPAPGYLAKAASRLDQEAAIAGRTIHPRDDVFKRLAGHYDFGETGRYVTRFWGCNMAVRADVFETVGRWDEHIGWGHEEKELADRILQAYPIYYDPELVVVHSYAGSFREYWRKRYRQEIQTPYYWETRGITGTRQWLRIARSALDPTNYLGRSLQLTIARSGGSIASTIGRLHGMARK